MRVRQKKDKGFTLVEVIVSMLVLSIMIVSVLSAFTTAAKSNTRTKKMQSADALLEDLTEYTKANAKGFDSGKALDELGRYTDLFVTEGCTVVTKFSDTNDVEVSELTGVKKGLHSYTVRITRDRKPAAYDTESMNGHKVITFGESGSNTVVINANVTEYDTDAAELFLAMHKEEIDRHNLDELGKAAENPDYTADVRPTPTEDTVKGVMEREIWLETFNPQSDKVQLKASMVYSVPDSLMLPDGADRQIKTEFFVSEVFDLSTSSSESAQKLKQIYVLYAPPAEVKRGLDADIRILDKARQLDANIFLAYQKSGLEGLDDAVTKNLAGRYTSSEQVRVSFGDATALYEPIRAGLYCSAALSVVPKPATVSDRPNSLVADDTAYRIVTIKLEVIDPETGAVLAETKEPVACLQ